MIHTYVRICVFTIRCIEIPDETCLSQITYSSYAPAAIVYTDELSNEIRTILRQLDPLNSCRGFLTFVMCAHRFPACNATTGRILPLCIADCPDINEIVAHCTMEFYMNSDYPLTFQLFDSFACESLSYLNFPLQYIETDPNECTEFSKYIIRNCLQRIHTYLNVGHQSTSGLSQIL